MGIDHPVETGEATGEKNCTEGRAMLTAVPSRNAVPLAIVTAAKIQRPGVEPRE
jgi:hypothetical protein